MTTLYSIGLIRIPPLLKKRSMKAGRPILVFSFFLLPLLFNSLHGQIRFSRNILDSPWLAGKPFRIQYIWEAEEKWDQLYAPMAAGLKIIDSSLEESVVISTDKKKLNKSWNQTFTVSAAAPGSLTLPDALVRYSGKTYGVRSIVIGISKKTPQGKENIPPLEWISLAENSILKYGESPEKKTEDLIFIRIEPNKNNCYLGEGIQVVYKLYTRVEATSEVVKRPSFHGYTVIDMLKSYDAEPEIEWWKGKAYYTHIIRKVHLFPLRTGILPLDEAVVKTQIDFKKIKENQSPAAEAGSDAYADFPYEMTLHSTPRTISVSPLPETVQAGELNLAVGRFTIEASTDKPVYQSGELGNIRVCIKGEGNLPMVLTPKVECPSAIRCMEPEIEEQYEIQHFPLQGKKIFSYRFMAGDTGTFKIPGIPVDFFEPRSKSYKKLLSEALFIKVIPSVSNKKVLKEPSADTTDKKGYAMVKIYFALLLIAILGWIIYIATKKERERNRETEKE